MNRTAAQPIIDDLTARLRAQASDTLDRVPIETYLACFNGIDILGQYRFRPRQIIDICNQIVSQAGEETLELYHRLVLAHFVGSLHERQSKARIPASVQAQFESIGARILRDLVTNPASFYRYDNDLFCKDLAICRLKLYPCGPQLVDVQSGIPRSWVLSGNARGTLATAAFFIAQMGGFKPLYEMHFDPRLTRDFNLEGWRKCYLRIAALLEMNPAVKGVFGSSWWFDPALDLISPNLTYLRALPTQFGARIFRSGSDDGAIGNSIKFSRERRQLYETGKYMPANYVMAWRRSDIIQWARSQQDGLSRAQ